MAPRLALLLCLFLGVSLARVSADTFVVTNTSDNGPGSLRQAIASSNAHPNSAEIDRIHFAIPGAGVQTITVTAALPDITEGVVLDGWSQPGFQGSPLIELTASSGLTADGLRILGGSTTIRGLVINRFQIGIFLDQKGGNTIQGCYVGTDSTATLIIPNWDGIVGNVTSDNQIGGTSAAARNVVSGNRSVGIGFFDDVKNIQSRKNVIQGNYVGTDITGTKALPNGLFDGVGIYLASNESTIGGPEPGAGNVVSGNLGAGIFATGFGMLVAGNRIGTVASGTSALGNSRTGLYVASLGGTIGGTAPGAGNLISGNSIESGFGFQLESSFGTIQGNFVGTDVTGKIALPNARAGMRIAGLNNLIGGSAPGAGNLISANGGSGLMLVRGISHLGPVPTEIPATDNIIQGNLIGTDVTGMMVLPNGTNDAGGGISIAGEGSRATGNRIGGTAPGAGNVISGNLGNGITIQKAGQTVIQGNLIGTGSDGTTPFANHLAGIFMIDCVSSTIGSASGPNPRAGNTIAFNSNDGIILRAPGDQVRISSNSIYESGQLGIDLGDDTVTPNDLGDADTGPNGRQNFPVISSAFGFNGKLTIYGSLNSVASKNFTLEFVASEAADTFAGFGEGQVLLGQARVTTDSSGNALFNVTFPLPANVTSVSATAIDSGGNTSEFSAAASISSTAPTAPPTGPTAVIRPHTPELLNLSSRLRVETGDGVLIGGFIVSGTEPKKIIVRGIGPSMAAFNLPDLLADPVLELYDSSGQLLAQNDNWRQNQEGEIQNSGLAPADDLESAIVRTVPAGNYTAILRGHDNTTGVGLVEVYDLDKAADSSLGNISTRGFVGSGDNVMISGFIAEDPVGDNVTVAIRGLGPSLASFGVAGFLADPTLELRNVNGTLVQSNNDWVHSEHYDQIKESGLEPQHSQEAMILFPVTPGNYSAILRGTSNGTGIGLLEVYNLR